MNIIPKTNEQHNSENCEQTEYSADFDPKCFIGQIRHALPYVFTKDGFDRYILITELQEDLEQWINAENMSGNTFRVLTENKEKELRALCRRHGFEVTRGSQNMEYMGHSAEIEYLRVSAPSAQTSVALIPWFMVPRKRYPVFVYLFAYWCCRYQNKSERESARLTGELFGVEVHYSTVNRSLNMAETLLDISEPVPTDLPHTESFDNILAAVSGILAAAADQEQLQQSSDNPFLALSNIRLRIAEFVRPRARRTARSSSPPVAPTQRKRKPETCPGGDPPGQKAMPKPKLLIGSEKEIRSIRKEFIAQCKGLILNAAKKYHRFML